MLRRFEQFTSAEARTWWAGGTYRLVTAHPDTPGDLPPDIGLAPFARLLGELALPFVTADVALRADGTWRLGAFPNRRTPSPRVGRSRNRSLAAAFSRERVIRPLLL